MRAASPAAVRGRSDSGVSGPRARRYKDGRMPALVRHPIVEALLVAAPLLVLYQVLAALHVEAELSLRYNYYFAADPDLYSCMFTELVAGGRRWMHPLLPIAPGLPGAGLVALGLPKLVVACAMNQLATLGALVLLQLVLRQAGLGFGWRALGALLFGLAFSTLLHGVTPESFMFGACALLGTVLFLQRGGRPGLAAALLAAACYGTTVTNLGAWGGMALAAVLLDGQRRFWRSAEFWRWVRAGVLGMVLMLAVWALYETAFGGWGQLYVEPGYETVWWNWPLHELERLRDLGAVFGAPDVVMMPKVFVAPLAFEAASAFGRLGTTLHIDADRSTLSWWPAILVYGCLLLACTRVVTPAPRLRRLAWLLLADLLLQLPVFFFYGDALLAYSVHWTFALCGGVVLVAHRLGAAGGVGLGGLVAALAAANLPVAFDVADAHLAWRDQQWTLAADGTAPGEFTVAGRVGMDRGRVRPFLLWPDARCSGLPDAPTDEFRLPPYRIDPADWRYLGDGTVADGEVRARGVLPPGEVAGPAWVSLRLDGQWRGFRVAGFTFPGRLAR
jgi:hypothetical protein